MKVIYRGHEIDVRRDKCMAGYSMLYYSIFRVSDWYECTSGFTEDSSTVHQYIKYMKERIDAELADVNPWGEKEE
jgi:hypothetical protein